MNNDKWIDTKTGLTWHAPESVELTYEESIKEFNAPNKRLPTAEEWKEAKANGLLDAFGYDKYHNNWYWSSTKVADSDNMIWLFGGQYSIYGLSPFNKISNYSIQCVSSKGL